MSRWFRFYDATLDDPKVQCLSDKLFRTWVNILCIASRNNGSLPSVSDMAFLMRLSAKETYNRLGELRKAGLIDDDPEGGVSPHNWNGRQFTSSDNSTGRVQKYRQKRASLGLPIMSDYSKFVPALNLRDGDVCVYCLRTENLCVDHMQPIAQGGTDVIDNLAMACKECNSGKAGRTPEQAGYRVRVNSASLALTRFRSTHTVTVSETPPDTDTDTDIPFPNGKGVHEPPDAELYRRGKEVLGASSGGMIRRLLASKGGNIPLARAALETASTKADRREYIGAIISSRNRDLVATDDLIS